MYSYDNKSNSGAFSWWCDVMVVLVLGLVDFHYFYRIQSNMMIRFQEYNISPFSSSPIHPSIHFPPHRNNKAKTRLFLKLSWALLVDSDGETGPEQAVNSKLRLKFHHQTKYQRHISKPVKVFWGDKSGRKLKCLRREKGCTSREILYDYYLVAPSCSTPSPYHFCVEGKGKARDEKKKKEQKHFEETRENLCWVQCNLLLLLYSSEFSFAHGPIAI